MNNTPTRDEDRGERERQATRDKAGRDAKAAPAQTSDTAGPNTNGQTVAPTPKEAKDEAQK